jgi:hypothetical protein
MASSAMATYAGSSQHSACHGMNTSGMSRGWAWCSRCLRASRESTLSAPNLRGFQCRMQTWITHSITGTNAISVARIISSHHRSRWRP